MTPSHLNVFILALERAFGLGLTLKQGLTSVVATQQGRLM